MGRAGGRELAGVLDDGSSGGCVAESRFPGGAGVKSPRPVQQRKRQFGSLGREAPRGRHGNPLRYSHLENPADREAWRTPVHTVTESARLKRLSRHDGRSQHSFVSTFLMFNLKNRRETELESQMFKKIKSLSLPRAQEG